MCTVNLFVYHVGLGIFQNSRPPICMNYAVFSYNIETDSQCQVDILQKIADLGPLPGIPCEDAGITPSYHRTAHEDRSSKTTKPHAKTPSLNVVFNTQPNPHINQSQS